MKEKFCELCGLGMELGHPTANGGAHLLCVVGVGNYEASRLERQSLLRTIHSLENSNILLKMDNNRLAKSLRRLKDEGYKHKPDTGEE